MRQYRGQRVDNKEWVYGYFVFGRLNDRITDRKPYKFQYANASLPYICPIKKRWGDIYYDEGCNDVPIEVIPETVGQQSQFNGLWEGDICEADYRCDACFDTEPHILLGTIEKADNGLWMFDFGHGSMPLECEELEVHNPIGNRWDNPELLSLEKTAGGKE